MKMETILSADGRYQIVFNSDYSGFVHITEFAGEAPKLAVTQTSLPMSMLNLLLDKMLFDIPPGKVPAEVVPVMEAQTI